MNKDIIVRGAREHNLKNITVTLPRNKFIVITGLSGSGKSTLAFDTIYAEGQRRYVESLSAYARQFLGLMNKPDIDSIDGLSPAISIEQKTTSKNPRSSVGTVTEIYDYLRLLFARIGVVHCPKCESAIKPQSAQNIVQLIMTDLGSERIILKPIVRGLKGTYEKLVGDLKKQGYTKIRVDGKVMRLDEIKELNLQRYEKHWIEAVIDSLKISEENRSRITEAVEHAIQSGLVLVVDPKMKVETREIDRGEGETLYTSHGVCPNHPEVVFEELEPRMFSFNSPFGACKACTGLGVHQQCDPQRIIPDESKTILDGAIAVYGKMDLRWRSQQIAAVGAQFGFDIITPIDQFTPKQKKILLLGSTKPVNARWSNGAQMGMDDGWEGIIPQTMRLHKQTESNYRKDILEKFMVFKKCEECKGKRLKPNVLSVKVNERSIIDLTDMSIENSRKFFMSLPESLSEKEKMIAEQILKEIDDRLSFLENVGLAYLNLSRTARTLSGGEAQRIRLATQIGSNLMGVMYILDEPSIGLHQRDNAKLIKTLHQLRDLGNTLIVVEHDEDTIRAADYVLDMGPGAGIHGGEVCASGTPKQIESSKTSITGQYLSGKKKIVAVKKYRSPSGFIKITGAKENNLKNLTVELPTGVLCSVTGVSGSGKSSLMNQTFITALQKHFGASPEYIGAYDTLEVKDNINGVIVMDQEPIGRTPRSNPATYIKLFDEIRTLFSKTKESRARGYKQGRFSFNVKGGRCESCKGDGLLRIEMHFLPDVFVQCEECKGKRYNQETLSIFYKEKNIADVLEMSVEQAISFFSAVPNMSRKLQTLFDVGLGYIKLGQSSTTLSGGESQRIKLTRELSKVKRGSTLYLLDEPTTGLHFEDVRKLIQVLNRLVDKGNTVYVIEHNLDVIKSSDYILDLGPHGGDKGGEIIAEGTPKQVSEVKKSFTGEFLKRVI
ncbi:MAG: excinuclease ABC subunit UvrA [Nanoarchaeota archaeon]|nr:excinuclease ABC subunit UvrA [Nanoarchaeota archaeon]